ncbi:hypothetical protein HID58_090101 [Brassica napus]|uniref:NB-ARC domain-containing protein n=1 Tax=Brassica napus TaxID=3708 RepID=A0ABQ7XE53_BRANA|nr:hypothetical protein HID58_090101 [Brassica napus]
MLLLRMCKQSQKLYRLGIWGMPGIGKTTIAQAVFNQMSHDFEVVCFLHDFHVMFHEKGLHILREEHSVEKLIGKTILVVLDDVRNPMEAESFLGGFDCFGVASLIIITSRDKQVLNQCQKEALQLFYGLAFPEEKPSDSKLVEASNKVVEYANGNPTALCLYGRELEGRTKEEEMEADFEKIKRQWPQREIIDMLKSSYDVLSDNERSIFLDVACFFNGEELDRIMQIFEGCGFFPHVGIERLVERSLLMISKNRKVEIHNLTRDVAREIVSEENYQILRRRRLWDPSSIRLLLEEIEPKRSWIINLSHSQKLVEVDELSKATSLKEIVLQGCTSLERTPRVDQLKKLQLLNISSCTRIKREEIIEQIKGLDLEGVLRETKSESMVFSTLVYVLCFFFSISSSMFLLLCSLFRRPRLLVVVGSVLHFLISFIKSYDFSQTTRIRELEICSSSTFNGLAWLFLDVSTNISLLYKEVILVTEFDPSHNKLAVSREQANEKGEKMYIQTRMAEYAEELWELLKKKTTPLFTCVVSRGGGGGGGGGEPTKSLLLMVAGIDWLEYKKKLKRSEQRNVEVY